MAQIFATKDDLHKVEHKFELGISGVEEKINQTKFDLIKWMVTLWIAQTVLFLSLIFGNKQEQKAGK
jgi:hypothetical protein